MSINLNKFKLKIDAVTLISWGDEECNDWHFSEISYEAKLLQPDEFRFKIHRDAFMKKNEDFTFEKATTWLGKEIECNVTGESDSNSLAFKGFVVEVQASSRYVIGLARSKECVLDDTRRCCSYLDNSLSNIIKDTLKDTKIENLTNKVDDELFTKNINYIVRYNETSYEFLTRLARQYGFSIYWNHTYDALMIDKLKGDNTVTMKNKADYNGYTYTMKTRCSNLHYAGYDYLSNVNVSKKKAAGGDNNAAVKDNMNFAKAKEASDRLFPDVPEARRQYYDYSIDGMGLTDDLLQLGDKSIKSQYIECTGKTNLFLSIGDVIELYDSYIQGAWNQYIVSDTHSPMIVTGVKYFLADDGLEGSFTAISAESEMPPYFDPNAYPKSGPQRAVVVANDDPDKLGRVKVQFLWQELIDKVTITPWIRIAQPYAGTDRGFYVLPEKGDEVMVGFEQNNVERPFVIGGLYHGLIDPTDDTKTIPQPHKSWTDHDDNRQNNIVKGFRTNCGQTVEIFDEASNEEENNGGEHTGKIHIYYDQEEKKKQDGNNQQGDNKAPKHIDYEITFSNGERTNNILVKGKTNDEYEKIEMKKLKIDISSNGSILIDTTENLILKGKNIIIAADDSVSITTDKFTFKEPGAVTLNTGISIKKNEKGSSEIFVNAGAAVDAADPNKADAISKIEMRGGKEEEVSIKVNVPSKIETTLAAGYTLKAKEITEKATDGDYTLTASAITAKATDGNYTLTASAITEKATDGEFSLEAKKITEKANGNYAVEAMSISEKANNDCKIEGATLTVEGKTTADFKGGATTNVKGGIVNIN